LTLANRSLEQPLSPPELHELAARLGADVPFFLGLGAQLARGDGTELARVELPTGYTAVLVVPDGQAKESTGAVYAAFDDGGGADGFVDRAARVVDALASVVTLRDLAALPRNDLSSSPLAFELETVGAFRADVSGAGPTVYGLFEEHEAAVSAAELFAGAGATYVARPVEASDLA
jgi:4-diphosphocytidyl-2-C-methyl-D-erythritol kinase